MLALAFSRGFHPETATAKILMPTFPHAPWTLEGRES